MDVYGKRGGCAKGCGRPLTSNRDAQNHRPARHPLPPCVTLGCFAVVQRPGGGPGMGRAHILHLDTVCFICHELMGGVQVRPGPTRGPLSPGGASMPLATM